MAERILILGGTGFTGMRLLALLQAQDDASRFTVFHRQGREVPRGFDTFQGDLKNDRDLEDALIGMDAVISLVPLEMGIAGKLIKLCETHGILRVLLVGSTGVFTDSRPKIRARLHDAEMALKRSQLDWTLLRPTLIYGLPGDRNFEHLLRWLKAFPILPVPGRSGVFMQPVHVDDAAQAVYNAFNSVATYRRAYNISGARPKTLREIVRLSAAAVGRQGYILALPNWPFRMLFRLLETLLPNASLREERLLHLVEDRAFEHGDATQDFNFHPRPFDVAILNEARQLGLRKP